MYAYTWDHHLCADPDCGIVEVVCLVHQPDGVGSIASFQVAYSGVAQDGLVATGLRCAPLDQSCLIPRRLTIAVHLAVSPLRRSAPARSSGPWSADVHPEAISLDAKRCCEGTAVTSILGTSRSGEYVSEIVRERFP